MAGPFSLSLAAVDILAQTLRVNVRLFPFEIPSVGRLQEDRKRIARVVFADLTKRGMIRDGVIDDDLQRALRTLSDYVIAVAVMGTVEETKEIYARASAAGETGVLAVKEGERLRLELIRPTALAMTVVDLLPKAEAGPGQSVTLTRPAPASGVRSDDEEADYFADVRQTRGADAQQLRLVESYFSRPRTGTGFFAVSGRGRHGREINGGGLTWTDTDAGRYLTLTRPPDEDGQVRATFSPADNARMRQQLGEMIESVAPRA